MPTPERLLSPESANPTRAHNNDAKTHMGASAASPEASANALKNPAAGADPEANDPLPSGAAGAPHQQQLLPSATAATTTTTSDPAAQGDVEAPKPVQQGADPNGITRDPTLQASTSDIIHRAIETHLANKHPSVKWPSPWNPPRSPILDSWPAIVFVLCVIGMNIGVNVGLQNDASNPARVATDFANMFTPAVLIPACASIFVLSLGTLKRLQLLAALGTGLVFVGASAFYVSSVFLEGHAQAWLWFAAAAVISCGAFMFLITIGVTGDHVQFAGAMLLCVGMELISLGVLSGLVVTTPLGQNRFNSANAVEAGACIVVVATLVLAYKAARDVERPLLKPTNYFFLGVSSYGCGAFTFVWVAGNTLAALYGTTDYQASPQAAMLASLFFMNGAMFMFLSSTRALLNLEMVIEDRYPSTTYLTPSHIQSYAFLGAMVFVLTFAFMVALGLYFASYDAYIVLWVRIVGYFFVVLAASVAVLATGKRNLLGALLLITGLVVFYFSLIMRLYPATVLQGFRTCIAGGGLVLASSFGFMPAAYDLRVKGIKPWLALLHPGSYFFIVFCYALPMWGLCQVLAGIVGQGLALSGTSSLAWERLGIAFLIQGALVGLLHGHMANEVVDSTYTASLPRKSFTSVIPKPAPTEEFDCDVVVLGAGTSGLALANELGARDVKTVVLEMRPDCIADARFLVLNGATVEGLHTLGVDAKLMESTRKYGINQDQPFGSAWINNGFGLEGTLLACANVPGRTEMQKAHPDMTIEATSRSMGSRFETQAMIRMMQSQQERVQRDCAEARSSCDVRYGHEVVDFEQRPDGQVVVTARRVQAGDNAPDATYVLRCRYFVACEGPGGPVAKKLKTQFDGFINVAQTQSTLIRAPGLWQKLGERFGWSHQYHVSRNGRVASFVAADHERGIFNIPVLLPRLKPTDDLNAVLADLLGPDQPFEVLKAKPWHMNFFLARDWVYGNVILCGDSAHSWPPFGGIGGNTGFADAHNLGWKLALCVKGLAGPHLLYSYEWERKQSSTRTALYVLSILPDTKNFLRSAVLAGKQIGVVNWVLRQKWLYAAQGLHAHNHFAQSGVQHGLRYDMSPIVVPEQVLQPDDPFHLYQPRVAAGARAPNFVLGDETLMYDSVALEGFSLLVFVSSHEARDASLTMIKSFEKRSVPLRVIKVHTGFQLHQQGDIHKETAALYTRESLVLLRPDRYCAWRLPWGVDVSEEEADAVVSHVCGWVEPDPQADAIALWLQNKFLQVTEPLTNTFPMAVRIVGETKEAALAKLKAKRNVEGVVTTKNA